MPDPTAPPTSAAGSVSVPAQRHAAVLPAAYRATWALFLVNGVLLSSWAVEIPAIQRRFDLDAAGLGWLLFAVVAGNTLTLPLVPWLGHRFGVRKVAVASLLVMAVTLALLGAAGSVALAALLLLLFGAAFSVSDLTLNTTAAWLEEHLQRPLMSGLHGAYSVGTLAGALIGGLVLSLGVSPAGHLLAATAVSVLLGLGFGPGLPGRWAAEAEPRVRLRGLRLPWPVTGLLILGFGAALCEGAVGDWSAVYLSGTLGSSPGGASLGFAGFAVAMVVGRLLGDGLTHRFGAARLGRWAALVMSLGFLLLLLAQTSPTGVAGFTLSGLGLSVLAPLLFSAAGRNETPAALPLLTGVFYGGFLLGPVLIAGLAHLSSLRLAFLLPLTLSVVFSALVTGWRLLPGKTHQD